jgi:hypothetical protein
VVPQQTLVLDQHSVDGAVMFVRCNERRGPSPLNESQEPMNTAALPVMPTDPVPGIAAVLATVPPQLNSQIAREILRGDRLWGDLHLAQVRKECIDAFEMLCPMYAAKTRAGQM